MSKLAKKHGVLLFLLCNFPAPISATQQVVTPPQSQEGRHLYCDVNLQQQALETESAKIEENARTLIKEYGCEIKYEEGVNKIRQNKIEGISAYIFENYTRRGIKLANHRQWVTDLTPIIFAYYFGLADEEEGQFFKDIEKTYDCSVKLKSSKSDGRKTCIVIKRAKKEFRCFWRTQEPIVEPLIKLLIDKGDLYRVMKLVMQAKFNLQFLDTLPYCDINIRSVFPIRFLIESGSLDCSVPLSLYLDYVVFGTDFTDYFELDKNFLYLIALLIKNSKKIDYESLDEKIKKYDEAIHETLLKCGGDLRLSETHKIITRGDKITQLLRKGTMEERRSKHGGTSYSIYRCCIFSIVHKKAAWELIALIALAFIMGAWSSGYR